jgi:hypothetical protein
MDVRNVCLHITSETTFHLITIELGWLVAVLACDPWHGLSPVIEQYT